MEQVLFFLMVDLIVFIVTTGCLTRDFTRYKIEHGCSYYDSVTGDLVDRPICLDKEK